MQWQDAAADRLRIREAGAAPGAGARARARATAAGAQNAHPARDGAYDLRGVSQIVPGGARALARLADDARRTAAECSRRARAVATPASGGGSDDDGGNSSTSSEKACRTCLGRGYGMAGANYVMGAAAAIRCRQQPASATFGQPRFHETIS